MQYLTTRTTGEVLLQQIIQPKIEHKNRARLKWVNIKEELNRRDYEITWNKRNAIYRKKN